MTYQIVEQGFDGDYLMAKEYTDLAFAKQAAQLLAEANGKTYRVENNGKIMFSYD